MLGSKQQTFVTGEFDPKISNRVFHASVHCALEKQNFALSWPKAQVL